MAELASLDWLINAKVSIASLEEPSPASASAHFYGNSSSSSGNGAASLAQRIASNALPALHNADTLPPQGGMATLVALAMLAPATHSNSNSNSNSALTATQAVRWIRAKCPNLHLEPAALRSAVRQALSESGLFLRQVEADTSAVNTTANTTTGSNTRPQRQGAWRVADACRARLARLARSASASLESFDAAVAQAVASRSGAASPTASSALSAAVKAAGRGVSRKRVASRRGSGSSAGSVSPTGAATTPKKRRGRRSNASITAAKKEARASELAMDAMLSGMSSPVSASDVESESSLSLTGEGYAQQPLQQQPLQLGSGASGASASLDLDLDLLLGHMDDPVLSQLLAADETPAHAVPVPSMSAMPAPLATLGSEYYAQLAMAAAAATTTPKQHSKAANGSAFSAALSGWDDCLRNLGDSFAVSEDVFGADDAMELAAEGSDWLAASFSGIDFGTMTNDVDIVAL